MLWNIQDSVQRLRGEDIVQELLGTRVKMIRACLADAERRISYLGMDRPFGSCTNSCPTNTSIDYPREESDCIGIAKVS